MVCDRMKIFASLLVLFISIGAQAREYATVRVSDIDIYCAAVSRLLTSVLCWPMLAI